MINGSVDIGYYPQTDGYGNADVSVRIIINYGREFIVLNESEMTELLDVVENVKYRHSIGDLQRVFNGKNGGINGEWLIKKQPYDRYIIIFTSNEGENQTIPYFMHEDMMKLIDLKFIIEGRIECMSFGLREIVEKIEGYADKYSNNPYKIFDDADCWFSDRVVVELTCNFMEFFISLITETKNAAGEHQHE